MLCGWFGLASHNNSTENLLIKVIDDLSTYDKNGGGRDKWHRDLKIEGSNSRSSFTHLIFFALFFFYSPHPPFFFSGKTTTFYPNHVLCLLYQIGGNPMDKTKMRRYDTNTKLLCMQNEVKCIIKLLCEIAI